MKGAVTLDGAVLLEVVMKLVGPIEAVGETHEDGKRLVNIKVLTDLVDELLSEIAFASNAASRQEASMKAIGTHAMKFLSEIRP